MHPNYSVIKITRFQSTPKDAYLNRTEDSSANSIHRDRDESDEIKRWSDYKRKWHQVFWSILLCIVSGFIIALAAIIGYNLSRNMAHPKSNGLACLLNCANGGHCSSSNTCTCPSGWSGSACMTPSSFTPSTTNDLQTSSDGYTSFVAICSPSCVNGFCSNPGVCTCNSGWNGSVCSDAICSPSCLNSGVCSAPNVCNCSSDYGGTLCDYPVCSATCQNGGNCTAPSVCQCTSNYTGSTCSVPVCSAACLNGGTCTSPETCTCSAQYAGPTCAAPVCTNPCQNNGTCAAPDTCTCTDAFNGSFCQYPVCNPNCLNGGLCIATNTCQCTPDVWTGPICQTPVKIFWSFDNNLDDLYNNFPGVSVNGSSFAANGINGYGSCLYLNRSASQSVVIYSPPFLNMAQTSFSLQAWIYGTSFYDSVNGSIGDNAIFGQHQNYATDQSLHIIVRDRKIYLGFYDDDTQGNQLLSPGVWYHMSYVYDYSSLTQFVYVNGVLDVSETPKGPYQGTSGDLTIGTNGVRAGDNYWDGCIDQVMYFARAKNATEVLRDATLTVAYTFDDTLLDSGPLGINGTGTNYSYSASGRVNRSLALLNNSSYVQATGLVLLGTNAYPYSLSIWIKPLVITQGTIIHVSASASGSGWCTPMLGFTSSGNVAAQSWNSGSVNITGPPAVLNVWSHIAVTYESTSGLRLWINGSQYGVATDAFSFTAANTTVTLTLGSSIDGTHICASGGINDGQYVGYMDEFRLYSRELSASDILDLSNT